MAARGTHSSQRLAILIEDPTRQHARICTAPRDGSAGGLVAQAPLDLFPGPALDDGLVLAGIAELLVADLTEVKRISE